MTNTHLTVAIPDAINSLPPRSRRGGGRNHQVFWSSSNQNVLAHELGSLSFSARTVTPKQHVTFGRKQSSFSFISRKTRTEQQGEGPWELLLAKNLEVEPAVVSYAFHNLETTWSDKNIVARSYGPDAIWADVHGQVVCAEVKASESYFSEPDTSALCAAATEGLETLDVHFLKLTGDALQEDRRRAFNISRAFADRLTALSPHQIDVARNRLAERETAVGELGELMGVQPSSALQAVNALMVRRYAAYDLSAPVTLDLLVGEAPAPAATRNIWNIGG
jgi:hypothetical protein